MVRDVLDVATRYTRFDGYGVNIYSVVCLKCGAAEHYPCISGYGLGPTSPHSVRYGMARKKAGIPVKDMWRHSRSLVWPHNV